MLLTIIIIGYLIGSMVSIFSQTFIELSTFTSMIIVLIIIIALYLVKDYIQNVMIILFSVYFGSLLTIRGLGAYTGSFPDEGYLFTLLKYNEYSQFKSEILGLIVLNSLVLCFLIPCGLIVQFSILNDTKSEENKKEGENGENKPSEK